MSIPQQLVLLPFFTGRTAVSDETVDAHICTCVPPDAEQQASPPRSTQLGQQQLSCCYYASHCGDVTHLSKAAVSRSSASKRCRAAASAACLRLYNASSRSTAAAFNRTLKQRSSAAGQQRRCEADERTMLTSTKLCVNPGMAFDLLADTPQQRQQQAGAAAAMAAAGAVANVSSSSSSMGSGKVKDAGQRWQAGQAGCCCGRYNVQQALACHTSCTS